LNEDVVMRSLALLVTAAAALSACASGGEPAPLTPVSRYALRVEPDLDRIALAVHEAGLSENQRAAISALAQRYRATGSGWLTVDGPAGNDPVAAAQTWAVHSALVNAGIPAERIRVGAYDAPDVRAPVLAGFETVRASIPDCSLERRDMGVRYSNQSSGGFGCAITANMAAQIAHPRDIVGARPMSPIDSGRAAVVFENYRRGDATSAAQEPLVQGQIAQAVE